MDRLYYNNIKPSKHSSKRIKQRAGGKTKKKRSKFIHGVKTKGLILRDIPERMDLEPFKNYMKREVAYVKKRNPLNDVYLYKDYFVIVSLTGIIITVLNIDKEYRGMYEMIYSCKNGQM